MLQKNTMVKQRYSSNINSLSRVTSHFGVTEGGK